jgi:D-alanyl-lipoteichoic acid acyltransferase DltB (MBOAT superfamily)
VSIVGLKFFVFVAATLAVYWIFRPKWRWTALLAASTLFVLIGTHNYALYAVFVVMTLITWGAALVVAKVKSERARSGITAVTIVALCVALICYKELAFFVNNINLVGSLVGLDFGLKLPKWVAPFGISYFTLILIGYLLDVRWGTIAAPQKNPLKMLLFAGYFPQLTSGPFSRYNDISGALYGGARWDLRRFQFGLQRFLWGLFKKLVIAERLAVIVATIYDSKPLPLQDDIYVGLMVVIGAFVYVAQLYTDFSGCMDMVIGVSEMLGIPLAENFKRPFTATSLSEIWRKWHITLGLWLKDYALYPTLKSEWLNKVRVWCKKKLGKKAAKDIPTYIGMLIVWFCVGFWHGGLWKYICGSGLFFFVMIVGGLILQPVFDKIVAFLRIDTKAYSWILWQRIRSFCLFAMAVSFGRRYSFIDGLKAWKTVFTEWNPWVLFDDTIFRLGLDRKDFDVMVLGLVAVWVVSMLQERHGSVRELIARQNLVFRWAVYLALFFAVLILGQYGPGYNPSDFIYGGF